MARMYPDDIEDYEEATDGEKRVFRFLKEGARPHKDFVCWYEPQIGSSGKEPDFILFSKKLGLLVLEVKDWTSKQITAYNPHQFTILISGKPEKKTNPDRQAKSYVNALKRKLRECPELLSSDPEFEGQLKIPIGRIVVFPNISRDEYAESNFRWFIESERSLFKDDLAAAGKILSDTSGRKFQERIAGTLPFRFRGLTEKEEAKLSFAIWPESRIDLPLRQGAGKVRVQREVLALDEEQARLALHLGSGHKVIKGPPGSGKTLVLVDCCCQLHRYHPECKRILLVCFNIALVSYLKRLIQEKGLGTGTSGIEVCHYYELCSQVLEKPLHYENEESEYYEFVTQEVLCKVQRGECCVGPFDAILVDEGQDFNNDMLKVLLSLLRPGGDMVISLDSHQDLYMRRPSWKSLGIKASGRTHYLRKVYRTTAEIHNFTQCLIGQQPIPETHLARLPYDFAFHGEPPSILRFQSAEDVEDFLIQDLSQSIREGEYKRSEIAIIYDDKVYGQSRFAYDNRALPMHLLKRLGVSGIPATWVSQDVRAKEMFDVTTDRVSLISIHSSKGLDFDLVYVIGIDHIHTTDPARGGLVALVYVAMTRAKYRLVIPYVEETELIRKMKGCLPREKTGSHHS
ncbi:MAG: NERD domain-containing protein [Deltaproteobacteria bacterium]|nr:NERD domain-containing protein [Deltaproteobacteria bacterium]